MKKIFNKSNQTVDPYRDGPGYPPPGQQNTLSGQQSRDYSQNDYRERTPKSKHANLPLSRNSGLPRGEGAKHSRESRSIGSGGAYPSYGEVHLDPNENRGGLAASLATNRGQGVPLSDQVSHQKLPPRSMPARPASDKQQPRAHSLHRSQPSWDAHRQDGQRERVFHAGMVLPEPLPNPHPDGETRYDTGPGRRSSQSRGRGATMDRMRSISRKGAPAQGGNYSEESGGRPTRRPSLVYGYDSGLHGGQAAVAAANANEGEALMAASRYSQDRDANVFKPESRYIDRYSEVKTPQSAAIGAGVDKMKRRLFGRRKKDDDVEDERKESSGEWARVEHPVVTDHQYSSGQGTPVGMEEHRVAEQPVSHHAPWFSGMKHNNKLSEGIITSQIGIFCINDEESWDWNQLMSLCNLVSHSEAASKEAARALRKEFKYGEEEPKYRAVRLWAIVCVKASDRFRFQIANKRFLEVLEDLYTDKKTSTKIQGRLLVAWSMLAHEFQLDQELHPISKMFNKIKPNDMPVNGVALDLSHDLFNPPGYAEQHQATTVAAAAHNQDIYHDMHADQQQQPIIDTVSTVIDQQQQQQPPSTRTQTTVTRTTSVTYSTPRSVRASQEESVQVVPRISDDIRRLHEECEVARSNAQLVTESLIEHGLQSDLVAEFAGKTQLSQDFILAQIPWASAQVDRSRAERQSRLADGQVDVHEGRRTEEEVLMEDLLDTHEKLIAANGMVEEARNRQQEEEEERQAIDRSMREQRIDRSQLFQDTATGHLYSTGNGLAPPSDGPQASSSRSASPAPPVARRPLPVPGLVDASTPMQKSLSTPSRLPPASVPPLPDHSWAEPAFSPLVGSDQLKPANSTSTYRGGPRAMNYALPGTMNAETSNDQRQRRDGSGGDDDSDDSAVMTPIAPSAKALGKRRALSIHDSSSPPGLGSATLSDLASHVDSVHLDSSIQEEALRARPPPALPVSTGDQHAPFPSTNPFHIQPASVPYNSHQAKGTGTNPFHS